MLGDLKSNLLLKYEKNVLATVYLAKYPVHTDPIAWGMDFLKSITPLTDHPDVLWVTRQEKENEYKVDSPKIAELLKFLNFRAFELKKKFIFITDAHLLSTIVSNKLLKVFEELPENFCLFLLAPQDETLLPTVESRAIKILLPETKNADLNETQLPNYASAQEFLADVKKSEDELLLEKKFIDEKIKNVLARAQYHECSETLSNLKHYSESESFNNSKISRISLLF